MKTFKLNVCDICGTALRKDSKDGIMYCKKCHPKGVDFLFFRLNKC